MDIINILIYATIGLMIGAVFSQILKVPGGRLGRRGKIAIGLVGALLAGVLYESLFEQRILELGILYSTITAILLLLGSRIVNKLT